MTQDEIIEMAIQAGIPSANVPSLAFGRVETGIELLESFAKKVAEKAVAKEREACAKVCEDGVQNATDWDSSYWDQACKYCASAIKAKEQA